MLLRKKSLLSYLICLVLGFSTGCASKVAVWERGNLARPQMALEPNALDAAIMKHTYSSKEASSGGYGVGGGGCGCN